MGNIYDGAFRTILNDCRKFIIPLINEIFQETYTGDEEIRFHPNEHFLDQQTAPTRNASRTLILLFLAKRRKNIILNAKAAILTVR